MDLLLGGGSGSWGIRAPPSMAEVDHRRRRPAKVALRLDPSLDALVVNGESGGWIALLAARRHRVVGVVAVHGLVRGVLGYRAAPSFRLRLRDRLFVRVLSFGEWLTARTADLVVPGPVGSSRRCATFSGCPRLGSSPFRMASSRARRAPHRSAWRPARHWPRFGGVLRRLPRGGRPPQGHRRRPGPSSGPGELGVPATLLTVRSPGRLTGSEIGFGWVDDDRKWQILSAADAFLFPTRYEAYWLAVREAASVGLPIVTTPESGVDEGSNGEDYVLCAPGDVEGFAQALVRLYQDPGVVRPAGGEGPRAHRILDVRASGRRMGSGNPNGGRTTPLRRGPCGE